MDRKLEMIKLNKFIILLLTLVIMQFTTACTKEPDCMVSDQVEFLKEFSVANTPYFLYVRRSGFSDKMSYLEFYAVKPDFDQCGEPSQPQLSQVPVSDLGNNPIRIVIHDLLIDVEYGEEPYSSPDLSLLPIKVIKSE